MPKTVDVTAKTSRKKLFDPLSGEPFKLSRSKIEDFLKCPRCFYLDRRLGIGRVDGPPFTLNTATDILLKKEFDAYRLAGTPHPLMVRYGIDAVPFRHPNLNIWRENFRGMQVHHRPTNFLVTGALDDIWVDSAQTLMIVDYKATCTTKEISLEDEYKQGYKRQMEIYQWLLRHHDFTVSDTGHFVFVNADTSRDAFNGTLCFTMQIVNYCGKDDWVEDALLSAHECLMSDQIPPPAARCPWCAYAESVRKIWGES